MWLDCLSPGMHPIISARIPLYGGVSSAGVLVMSWWPLVAVLGRGLLLAKADVKSHENVVKVFPRCAASANAMARLALRWTASDVPANVSPYVFSGCALPSIGTLAVMSPFNFCRMMSWERRWTASGSILCLGIGRSGL